MVCSTIHAVVRLTRDRLHHADTPKKKNKEISLVDSQSLEILLDLESTLIHFNRVSTKKAQGEEVLFTFPQLYVHN